MYLQPSINHLAYNINKTLIIHIEQCKQSLDINSCELYDHRKRVLLIESNPEIIRSDKENNLCLLKCSISMVTYSSNIISSILKTSFINSIF